MKYVMYMVLTGTIATSINSTPKKSDVSYYANSFLVQDTAKKTADTTQRKSILKVIRHLFRKKTALPVDSNKIKREEGQLQKQIIPGLNPSDSLQRKKAPKTSRGSIKKTVLKMLGFLQEKGVIRTHIDSAAKKKEAQQNFYTVISHDSSKKKSSPIKFHGNAVVSGYYSDYTYPGQATPSNYVRWQLNPTLEVFGIPLKANAIVSTEQNVFKNFDAFSISFDWARIQEIANQALKNSVNEKQMLQNE